MKKKFSKIFGVALALVLVVSLGVFVAVPADTDASPAANKWAKFSIPSAGSLGDYILVPVDTDNVSTWVAGPAFLTKSKDGDLWVYWDVSPTATASSNLFKSTDEGRSWDNMGASTSVVADKVIVDIACSPEDNDIVYVADTSHVYKTDDGGSTWATMPDIVGMIGSITCLDTAYSDRHYVVVGTDNTTNGEVYVKPDLPYEIWEAQQIPASNAVMDVAFSPNFATETNTQIVAVTDNATSTFVRYQWGGGDWNTKAELLEADTYNFSDVIAADIGFPDDYDSTASGAYIEVFVGIHADNVTCGDVYYITYTTSHDKGLNKNVSSIDLDGSASDCCILAADYGSRDIYRSTDAGATWFDSKQDPSGPASGNAYVVVDDDFFSNGKAWVATQGGGAGDQCAISLADRADYGNTWIQISMINTEIDTLKTGGLAFSPVFATDNTMFMITTALSNTDDSLWWWDGSYWSRVHDNDTEDCDIDAVQVSPDFAESNTVYLADKDAKRLWYSKDGGERFIKQSSGPAAFSGAWVVLDYNTVLVGDTAKVYKATRRDGARYSTKYATGFGTISSFAVSPDYESDTTVMFGDDAGRVGLSTNSGDSFKQKPGGVKVKSSATTCYVAFDSDYANNGIIYAAANGSGTSRGVYRLEVDVSTGWSQINYDISTSSPATPVAFGADPSGIVAANDAVYCAVETDAAATPATILVSRSINPATGSTTSTRGVYFEPMKTSFTGTIGNTTGIWVTGGASNILWIEEVADVSGGTNAIWKYEDALIAATTLTEPADTSSTGRTGTATLKWAAMDGATRYVIWVASNEDFSPLLTDWTDTNKVSSTASYSVSGLAAGKTYYWKMRSADSVDAIGDTAAAYTGRALSPWSEVWSFATGIAGGEWNPFLTPQGFAGNVAPQPGAQDVILRPSFQWNAADWATGYEFVLADNTAFTSPIKEFVGADALTTAVYALDTDLTYSTEYYWKVRAVSDTSESIWATGVFTTMEEPVEAPAPVEITPAPPAPVLPIAETPAYVWAIIAIGAVLVIALIILIVRTRRAV